MDKNDVTPYSNGVVLTKLSLALIIVHINYMDAVEYYLNTNTKCPKLTFSSFTNH